MGLPIPLLVTGSKTLPARAQPIILLARLCLPKTSSSMPSGPLRPIALLPMTQKAMSYQVHPSMFCQVEQLTLPAYQQDISGTGMWVASLFPTILKDPSMKMLRFTPLERFP